MDWTVTFLGGLGAVKKTKLRELLSWCTNYNGIREMLGNCSELVPVELLDLAVTFRGGLGAVKRTKWWWFVTILTLTLFYYFQAYLPRNRGAIMGGTPGFDPWTSPTPTPWPGTPSQHVFTARAAIWWPLPIGCSLDEVTALNAFSEW